MGIIFTHIIQAITNLFRLIYNVVTASSLKKKLKGINPKNIKQLRKLKGGQKLAKLARKLKKKKIKIGLLSISLFFTTIIILIVVIIVLGVTAAFLSATSDTASSKKSYETILYENKSGQPDTDNNNLITLSSDKIRGAKAKYDGTFALQITFWSREYTNDTTTFELYKLKDILDENKATTAEGAGAVGNGVAGAATSKASPIATESTAMTKTKGSTVEINLGENCSWLSEEDGVIKGSNYYITKVSLIDKQKRDKQFKVNEALKKKDDKKSNNMSSAGLCKDPVLRNWQLIFQYSSEASDDAVGINSPIGILANMFCETGSYSDWNNDSFDVRTDLASGGDGLQSITYDKTNMNVDPKGNGIQCTFGISQWEKWEFWEPYRRKYKEGGTSDLGMDSELGFVRPNAWYYPDDIWSSASKSLSWYNDQIWVDWRNSSGFEDLSDDDKAVIVGFITRANHRAPATTSHADSYVAHLCEFLIQKAKDSGSIINYVSDTGVSCWDSDAKQPVNCGEKEANDLGLGPYAQEFSAEMNGYGFAYSVSKAAQLIGQDLCKGSIAALQAYDSVGSEIDKAEKEAPPKVIGFNENEKEANISYIDDNGTEQTLTLDCSENKNEISDGKEFYIFGQWGAFKGRFSKPATFLPAESQPDGIGLASFTNARVMDCLWGFEGANQGSWHTMADDSCAMNALANTASNLTGRPITAMQIVQDSGGSLYKAGDTMYIDTQNSSILSGGRDCLNDGMRTFMENTYGIKCSTSDSVVQEHDCVFWYMCIANGNIDGISYPWHYVTCATIDHGSTWWLFGDAETVKQVNPYNRVTLKTNYDTFYYIE